MLQYQLFDTNTKHFQTVPPLMLRVHKDSKRKLVSLGKGARNDRLKLEQKPAGK